MKKYSILILSIVLFASCGSEKKNLEEANEHLKLARKYNAESQWDKSIASAEDCLEIDSDNAEAYFILGNAYFNLDKWEKSLESYNKSIEKDSTYADAYFNRGNVKFYLHDKDGACADYLKAKDLGKDNVSGKLKGCY